MNRHHEGVEIFKLNISTATWSKIELIGLDRYRITGLFNLADRLVVLLNPLSDHLAAAVIADPCAQSSLQLEPMKMHDSGFEYMGDFISLGNSLYEVGGGWDDCRTFEITLRAVTDAELQLQKTPVPDLAASLRTLIDSEDKSDVAFMVQGRRIRLCRAVLAARSEYFNKLFFGTMKSKESHIDVAEGISVDAFMAVVNWLHTDVIGPTGTASLAELLHAANFYQLREMENQLVKIVVPDLKNSSVVEFLKLADSLTIPSLKSACLEYIWGNYMDLAAAQAFAALNGHSELLIEIMHGIGPLAPQPQKKARIA